MKSKAIIGGIIVLIILLVAILACVWAGSKINEKLSEINPNQPAPQNEATPQPTQSSGHLALGNPSNASNNPDNFLMQNDYFALSYNREKGLANWVAWSLSKGDFGSANRQNDFRPDDRLPGNWTRILPSDYSGSGFDR
nr:DNA/RNA non-specific endonuclease [Pyrinomonadaceae bacterium]